MMERIRQASPRFKARIAGVFYLIAAQAYEFAEFSVRGKLVVYGDAAATAHNILAHEPRYRLGFAAELISAVCFIAVTLLFYDMFMPVNRSLSLLAAFFSLAVFTLLAASFISPPWSSWEARSTWAYLRWNSCRRWRLCFSYGVLRPPASTWYFSDAITS